jgi:hypothetical protein
MTNIKKGETESGLHFCYIDIFDPGQVCKNRKLKVMLLEEGTADSGGRVVEDEEIQWWR